jgi:hypothetical protein
VVIRRPACPRVAAFLARYLISHHVKDGRSDKKGETPHSDRSRCRAVGCDIAVDYRSCGCWAGEVFLADDPNLDTGWPPRLTVDTARILEVLTGDRFYSSKDAALREAVLNAIDACTARIAEGDAIQPAMSVVFDDGTLSVIIDDNGDGMGREQVSDRFIRIGSSMAQVATEVETIGRPIR